MALFVKQTPQYNRVYLQIIDGVYDKKTKKVKHIVYKKLGYLDELEKTYNDPINHFKDWCKKENKNRREKLTEEIPKETKLINLGYFPFYEMYKRLNINTIINNYQRLSEHKERYKLGDVFESLVYARILYPSSKKDTYDNFKDTLYHKFNYSSAQMYEGIEHLGKRDNYLFDGINYMISSKYRRNLNNVYFDATNFYFEIDKPNEIAKMGVSKENRKSPIIGLGLLLDGNSIPLDYKIYPGNESERTTYHEILDELKKKNDIKGKIIRIADKGLNSGESIKDAILAKDGYIFSESIKGAKQELIDFILKDEGYKETFDEEKNLVYKVKSRIDYEKEISITVNGKKKKVNIKQKQIVFYSRDYALKTKLERNKALTKTLNNISKESTYKRDLYGFTSKYVEETYFKEGIEIDIDKVKSLNLDKIHEDELLDGYYLIVTSELNAKDEDIIEAYHSLWDIEESFRIMKTTLKTRPVYHSLIDSIKGHFLICMTALLIVRLVEKIRLKSKVSASKLISSLKKYQALKVSDNKYQLYYYDETLNILAQFFGVKLNQHYKNEKEIKEIFKDK